MPHPANELYAGKNDAGEHASGLCEHVTNQLYTGDSGRHGLELCRVQVWAEVGQHTMPRHVDSGKL